MSRPLCLSRGFVQVLLLLVIGLASSGCVVVAPVDGQFPTEPMLVPTFTATPLPEAAASAEEAEPEAVPTATPTPLPTPTASSVDEGLGTGSVTAQNLNMRSGPGLGYAILGQLHRDDAVTLLERSGDQGVWWRVCCLADQVTDGWVSGDYLNVSLTATPTEGAVVSTPVPWPSPGENLSRAELREITIQIAMGNLPDFRYSHAPTAPINPLTGLQVAPQRLQQRPLAVCIPSDVSARPQSGLSQADVVYEYLVDGNQITRMTGIFYGEDIPLIGPIRSARLINFYLGYQFNAATMCSGASDYIRVLLREVSEFPFFDIDLDNPNAILPYSLVLGSGLTRFHTNTQGMRRWLQDTLWEQPIDLAGFQFGEAPASLTPAAYIYIPYPTVSSAWVEFRYDPASGQYLRSVGGQPHLDRNGDVQIAPHNVIVQYVPHVRTALIEDALGSRSIDQNIFGSGRAIVFRDGFMYEGTWTSDVLGRMPRFQTTEGVDIPLRPGRTWIALLPAGYQVTTQ